MGVQSIQNITVNTLAENLRKDMVKSANNSYLYDKFKLGSRVNYNCFYVKSLLLDIDKLNSCELNNYLHKIIKEENTDSEECCKN